MTGAACWVCGAGRRRWLADGALEVDECARCGHLEARHASEAQAIDYHLAYDQGSFASALAATRSRQARLIVAALERVTPARALFDFGCGRGFFLETARASGFGPLAGGDSSAHALELLAQKGIRTLALDPERPFERLDFAPLGHAPEILSFLDVLEHFPGDLATRLAAFLASPPAASIRTLVIKVPIRDGLLFGLAAAARQARLPGLLRQLFQVGSFPPHYQYFSKASLDRFVERLGFRRLACLDDADIEAGGLSERAVALARLPRPMVTLAGHALVGVARAMRRLDTRVVILGR